MKRRALTSVFTATAMAFALPVLAQDKGQSGARPNPSGSSSGSAVSRPSGGSGGSSSGGSSTSSSPSGGSSGSAVSRPSGGGGAGSSGARAPSRPERRNEPRAVPRSVGSDQTRRVSPAGGASASAGDDNGDRRRAVPAYSRPRDGRPTIGSAVERTGRPPDRIGIGTGYYYNPYSRFNYFYNRYPYGYFWPGYGFGVGYFYDPWMWGYNSPYGYGGYYDPYAGYGGGGSYGRSQYHDTGSLRLKVKPEHGQVYVDGYYVGEVDSFDGVFQKLAIEAGTHRIEIRAEGYEPAQFEVMVIRGETVTYKGDLKRQ